MKITCTKNPKHTEFESHAHQVNRWKVDELGHFLDDLGCSDVTHRPNAQDIFTCSTCGEEAEVAE